MTSAEDQASCHSEIAVSQRAVFASSLSAFSFDDNLQVRRHMF